TFTTNLEHIGDIVDKNLMELAGKKIKHKRRFSEDGAAELTALHRRVLDNLKLALGVFISGDVKIARQLLDEKVAIRDAERAAAALGSSDHRLQQAEQALTVRRAPAGDRVEADLRRVAADRGGAVVAMRDIVAGGAGERLAAGRLVEQRRHVAGALAGRQRRV